MPESIQGQDISGVPRNVTVEKVGNKVGAHFINISEGGGSSSGGASAGDLSTYVAKPSGTNADATSVFESSTSIRVMGLNYQFVQFDIVSIVHIPATGSVTRYTDLAAFTVSGTTGNQVINVTGANFSGADNFIVTLQGLPKTIDEANDAQNTDVINPAWSRWTPATQEIVTSETNGTVNRYISMDGFSDLSIQFEKSGGLDTVTFKIYGSLQDDGTVDSLKSYQDISQHGVESATASATAASYTADVILHLKKGHNYKTIKIETVSSGGNNDANYSVFAKKSYS